MAQGCGRTPLTFRSWRSFLSYFQNQISEEVGVGESWSFFLYPALPGATGVSAGFHGNLGCGSGSSSLVRLPFPLSDGLGC